MSEIKIKRLENLAKNAFRNEEDLTDKVHSRKTCTIPEDIKTNMKNFAEKMKKEMYITPVLDEIPKEDLEEMAFFDSDGNKVRVYAEQGLIDDMQQHSSCDFKQDSIQDAKESRPKKIGAYYDPDEVREAREAVNKETPVSDNPEDTRESRIQINKENHKNIPVKVFENSRKMAEEIDKHRCGCQDPDPYEDMFRTRKVLNDAAKKILGVDDIPEDLSGFYTKNNRPAEHEPVERPKEPVTTDGGEFPKYEFVNHPQHYNNYDMEVIDMMTRLFGVHETISFCKLNAFKYRMRAGTKPGESAEQDIRKEQWYLDKAKELEGNLF